MILRHAQWLDTGSATAHDRWRAAEQAVPHGAGRARRAVRGRPRPARVQLHRRRPRQRARRPRPGDGVAGPGAAPRGPRRAGASGARAARFPGAAAARALVVAATRPWRLGELPPRRRAPTACSCGRSRLSSWWPAAACYTWFAAPAHLVVTLGAWLVFAAVLRWVVRGRDPFAPVGGAGRRGAAADAILLVALVVRGPGRLLVRLLDRRRRRAPSYITVAFAAFCWLFVVVAVVLRRAYGLRRRAVTGRDARGRRDSARGRWPGSSP